MKYSVSQLQDAAIQALNRGDLRSVQQHASAILQKEPQHADAHFMLSIVAAAAGQVHKAIDLVGRALEYRPGDAEYLTQKARYHAQLNQYLPAITTADAAMAANPKRALLLDTLGVVYSKFDEHEKAIAPLRAAVSHQPQNPQFQFNLASSEQFLGNDDSARRGYERAIALRPGFARAHWALSELEKNQSTADRRQTLSSLLEQPNIRSEDQLYLSHALARELERNNDPAAAFQCLEQAKSRHRQQIGYEFSQDEALFTALKNAFTEKKSTPAANAQTGEEMLFVLGMPRSGTTLVERILGSHSQVQSLGELHEFPLAVKQNSGVKSPRVLDSEVISKAKQCDPADIGRHYLARVHERERSQAPVRIIDKLPMNFLYIGFILQSLPGAKVIVLDRNPLDTCLSNYRQLFSFNFRYYHYHYSLTDTARYICAFSDLMHHWQSIFGERIYRVNYETLTEAPEAEARAMTDFAGLEWQAQCLEFHKSREAVSTASSVQVRQPIYRNAVERWRRYEKQLAPATEIFREKGLI